MRLKIILGSIFTLSLIGNIYLLTTQQTPTSPESTKALESTAKPLPYTLLSPRLFAENQNDIIINFMDLRKQLRADVETFPFKVGFYFEYLPSGTSIGVKEKEEFAIASLLKVPLVMATYKASNDNKISLSDNLIIRQSDLDPGFGELYKKGAGTKIELREAMRLSLVQSDNTAKNIITNTIPLKYLEDVFDSLDIAKDIDGKTILISPKGYASILRALYLSSYLPYEQSNQILTWLSETRFNDKVAAGVPSDIKVAHKIGSFETKDTKDNVFTDCGIIYVPKRPYILCVMVNADEDKAKNAMQFISEHIYKYVSSVNLN